MSAHAPSVQDFLSAGSGGKSLKFPDLGDISEGTIISAEVKQAKDIDGELKTWANGDPVYELQIKVQTDLSDDDDDSGERVWYCSGGKGGADDGVGLSAQEAVKEALKEAGMTEIPIGGTLRVRYSGTKKPAKRSHNPAKRYSVKFIAAPEGSSVSVDDF